MYRPLIVWRGYLPRGGCLLGGLLGRPPGTRSRHPPRPGADPPVNRITDMSKNITLATTSLRPVTRPNSENVLMVGNVFTGVCLSPRSGDRVPLVPCPFWEAGYPMGVTLPYPPSGGAPTGADIYWWPPKRVIRILLECILVRSTCIIIICMRVASDIFIFRLISVFTA